MIQSYNLKDSDILLSKFVMHLLTILKEFKSILNKSILIIRILTIHQLSKNKN